MSRVTAMRGSELDERELALRERALADAHRFVGVLLVCGMVLATLLASDSVSKDTALARPPAAAASTSLPPRDP